MPLYHQSISLLLTQWVRVEHNAAMRQLRAIIRPRPSLEARQYAADRVMSQLTCKKPPGMDTFKRFSKADLKRFQERYSFSKKPPGLDAFKVLSKEDEERIAGRINVRDEAQLKDWFWLVWRYYLEQAAKHS